MSFFTEEVVSQALSGLGLQKTKKLDINKVLSKFLKGDIEDAHRIEHKNTLLVFLIESLKLNINTELDLGNKCSCCQGRGFDIIQFGIELTKCPLIVSIDPISLKKVYSGCNGTGWKIGECTRCQGTGRIGEIPCGTCKGWGTYLYKKTDKYDGKKCLICHGTGQIKKMVPRNSEIKEISTCVKCNGKGISTDIGTTVLSPALAEKLKKVLPQVQTVSPAA
jgi:hypothetical protein